MIEIEVIKSSLMSAVIVIGIFGFIWFKWKDELLFNYNLIKAKILPSKENDDTLMEQAFAPRETNPLKVVGNWLEGFKRVDNKTYDDTDYFQRWERENPWSEE